MIRLGFSQNALLDLIGAMEDKVSAYLQNIKINQPVMDTGYVPVKTKVEKRIDTGFNDSDEDISEKIMI